MIDTDFLSDEDLLSIVAFLNASKRARVDAIERLARDERNRRNAHGAAMTALRGITEEI